MIVVSLTTIPTRFDNVGITINSILSQTVLPDLIILHIPERYNNYTYSTLPVISDKVIINNNVKDYGPATKLLGLKQFNLKDDDIIIVIDDDRIYNNNLIQNMLHYHNLYNDKVLTVAGWDIETLSNNLYKTNTKKQPRGVEYKSCGYIDVLGGCCGFLLTRKMCPFNNNDLFSLTPLVDFYYVDDVWISGFLKLNNIDIYLIPNSINRDEQRHINDSISPLCDTTRTQKNINCIKYFREMYKIFYN